MKIGFTGTQKGMKATQAGKVYLLLNKFNMGDLLNKAEFHHGDCFGADAQAHNIAKTFNMYIIIHPPINSTKRAFCKGDLILPEKEYLDRNKDIVKSCELLLATPNEFEEQLRSGTWSTIRFARKRKKQIIIVFPDGSVNEFK